MNRKLQSALCFSVSHGLLRGISDRSLDRASVQAAAAAVVRADTAAAAARSRPTPHAHHADPFNSLALPEVIEEFLDFGTARCIAFNRWGTLLAGVLLGVCDA